MMYKDLYNNLLPVILTFSVSGFICSALLKSLFSRKYRRVLRIHECLIIGFVLGPIIISFLLFLLLKLLPQSNRFLYISAIIVFFIIPGLLVIEHIKELFRYLGKISHSLIRRKRTPRILLFFLMAVLLAHLFYQALSLPVYGHDAVLYSFYGKNIFTEKKLDNYPLKNSDSTLSKTMAIRHAPALPLIYTWFHLLKGNSKSDLSNRAVSPIYGFYLMVIICLLLRKRVTLSTTFAVMIIAATPVLYYQTIGNYIDPIRLSLMMLFIYLLYKFLIDENRLLLALLIITMGLGFYTHLSILISLPISIVIYITFSKKYKYKKSSLAIISILFIASQIFLWNSQSEMLQKFSIIGRKADAYSALERSAVFGSEWADKVKKGKVSGIEMIWKERLQIMSRPEIFGLTFYFAAAGIIIGFILKRKSRLLDKILLSALLLFAIPVLCRFYMNYRYISTITPIAIYFAAIFSANIFLYIKRLNHQFSVYLIKAALILTTLFVTAVFLIGVSSVPRIGNKSIIPEQLLKFAKWKSYAHPRSRLAAFAEINPESSLLIIGRDHPVYRYYLSHCKLNPVFPSETKKLRKLRQKQDVKSYLREKDISHIIVEPRYSLKPAFLKSQISEMLTDNGSTELLYHDRGFKLYRITFEQ